MANLIARAYSFRETTYRHTRPAINERIDESVQQNNKLANRPYTADAVATRYLPPPSHLCFSRRMQFIGRVVGAPRKREPVWPSAATIFAYF